MIRKVKEHHRKKRREENKNKRLGIKKKEPKDPGIPSAWPFKEELIAQLKAQKERADAKQHAITMQRRAEKVRPGGLRQGGVSGWRVGGWKSEGG